MTTEEITEKLGVLIHALSTEPSLRQKAVYESLRKEVEDCETMDNAEAFSEWAKYQRKGEATQANHLLWMGENMR